MLQERPAVCFLELIASSSQSKAGRAPTGRSRHQPHPSQTPSPAVLTSMVFLTSYPEGLANWVSSHRPRGIPTVLSTFNCLCLLSPLSFLFNFKHIYSLNHFEVDLCPFSSPSCLTGTAVIPQNHSLYALTHNEILRPPSFEYVKEGSWN